LTSQAWHQSQTDSDLLHHIPTLLLPPPLLHYKTQTDRQIHTHTHTQRNSGEKRQEARATKRGSAEQCSATAATVLSKESREKRANANYANASPIGPR